MMLSVLRSAKRAGRGDSGDGKVGSAGIRDL